MFQKLITPDQDFEDQLRACVNAMCQDDAIGQTLVFKRDRGKLHTRYIATHDAMLTLMDSNIDRYEMLVFDGGNTSGDSWKHVFFPRQRTHCFVYEA